MNTTPDSIRQLSSRFVTAKLIVIGVLLVLFFIPSVMVSALVQERSGRQQDTTQEVGGQWGKAQAVVGPILMIPYRTAVENHRIEYAYFLPETVAIKNNVTVETRSRGIYAVPVYEERAELTGSFAQPNIAALNIHPSQFLFDKATAIIGIPDLRGVKREIVMQWAGREYRFASGVETRVVSNGVSTGVALPRGGRIPFSVTLELRGSEALAFSPVGKTTKVTMESNWSSPSFTGSFLPATHTITDTGFTAEWELLDLNRSFPQQWTGETDYRFVFDHDIFTKNNGRDSDRFGLRFMLPVDVYDKTGRSVKYAMAVLALVFASVFFTESTSRRRVHPAQYLLIGLALIIFYALLLSLAEYIPFGYAYLIAGVAIIGMVTLFTRSVTKSTRLGVINGGILTALYGFVYVLLQMEDFTLLIGSIGLFVMLAIMMFVSRKINWYGTEDAQ
ncbi:MAG: cell envelope integrity protein CreD [Candidatus Magasanikbacteria bacterium]|nr:cell envelope integrity protein CreD [Candidatus Magasanikbacteria bacterium]